MYEEQILNDTDQIDSTDDQSESDCSD